MKRDRPTTVQDLRRRLHRQGRRLTPQRAAILESLRQLRTHPTAEELLDRMRETMPQLSLGTIYRNLQILVKEGFALKLPSSHGSHRFDGDASRHHHVVCECCGHVEDVFLARAPEVLRRVAQMTGYDVYPREMIFHGRCPACRNAAEG